MHVQVIGFIPPFEGLDGNFNTFRIGGALAKRIACDDTVFLMNEKTKVVFGTARVTRIEVGKLQELCDLYGHENHSELNNEREGAGTRLLTFVTKIYGPHIAPPTKKCCVVWLERIE